MSIYQPSHFSRVHAAYGGCFIVLRMWLIDHVEPDRFDVIGAMVGLIGATVMMYWPRQQKRPSLALGATLITRLPLPDQTPAFQNNFF
ncbi:MAG: hypothetical protein JSR62_13490 [Nitrospira sp.]|nr:hypothetical protein [Nitrospira sp.]